MRLLTSTAFLALALGCEKSFIAPTIDPTRWSPSNVRRNAGDASQRALYTF